ncbi:heterokaryon incompatibility protein-domain-containing protein [Xylaria grammica]|nr:heterokaryon incompatibility protein-domain-containing protein [Xylaria grammica]
MEFILQMKMFLVKAKGQVFVKPAVTDHDSLHMDGPEPCEKCCSSAFRLGILRSLQHELEEPSSEFTVIVYLGVQRQCGLCTFIKCLLLTRYPDMVHNNDQLHLTLQALHDAHGTINLVKVQLACQGAREEVQREVIPFLTLSSDAKGKFSDKVVRRIVGGLGSEDMMSTVRSWIERCDSTYINEECGTTSARTSCVPPMPTRVIDLGDGESAPARLVLTRGRLRQPYVALIHRWGDFNGVMTTTKSLRDFETRLPIEKLPRAFQDIFLLLKRLGLRYVWVDIICIVQDDDAEWTREAAAFGTIFDNAYLTVAASSTLDASSGTSLANPQYSNYHPIHPSRSGGLYVSAYKLFSFDELESLPLYSRAWIMQEVLFSNKILHIGRDQLYWQCGHTFEAENGEIKIGTQLRTALAAIWVKQILDDTYYEKLCFSWCELLTAYSRCQMSFAEDKLPGLSNIAAKISNVNPVPYIQGHWFPSWRCSACSLLWFAAKHGLRTPSRERRPSRTIFPTQTVEPSWSWAFLDGPIEFLLHRKIRGSRQSHDEFTHETADVRTLDPYLVGTSVHVPLLLSSQVVSLSSKGCTIRPSRKSENIVLPSHRCWILLSADQSKVGWLCFDQDSNNTESGLIIVQLFTSLNPLGARDALCLVVQRAEYAFPDCWYCRLGIACVSQDIFSTTSELVDIVVI